MKYQCNSCAKVYDMRQDAVNCHPDINEIPDELLESHLAAQQGVQLTGFPPNHRDSRFCECVVCMGMATVKPASN